VAHEADVHELTKAANAYQDKLKKTNRAIQSSLSELTVFQSRSKRMESERNELVWKGRKESV
jgi:hypothetical protein